MSTMRDRDSTVERSSTPVSSLKYCAVLSIFFKSNGIVAMIYWAFSAKKGVEAHLLELHQAMGAVVDFAKEQLRCPQCLAGQSSFSMIESDYSQIEPVCFQID